MINILKIGDNFYGQSIQETIKSYAKNFPQREFFLHKYTKKVIRTDFYRHNPIKSLKNIQHNQQRLKQYLINKNYDYIMIDNPLSCMLVDNLFNIPILFDCIDWYDEMYLKEFGVDRRYYLLRYAYLTLLKRANKVIAQSPIILDYLTKWGLKTTKTKIIPNGYDADFFYPYSLTQIQKCKKNISQKYNISFVNKKVIVYVGKLNKWYENIKIIIEAINKDQIMLIVGDGPIYTSLPNKTNVIKCGQIDISQVPSYTNIADVCVFPVDDCSPIVISEYLAVGKPIVSIKGRISWLLKNEKNGYLVDNNILSWRNGINKAIRNRKKISINNLHVSKKMSWEKLSQEFIEFVRSS